MVQKKNRLINRLVKMTNFWIFSFLFFVCPFSPFKFGGKIFGCPLFFSSFFPFFSFSPSFFPLILSSYLLGCPLSSLFLFFFCVSFFSFQIQRKNFWVSSFFSFFLLFSYIPLWLPSFLFSPQSDFGARRFKLSHSEQKLRLTSLIVSQYDFYAFWLNPYIYYYRIVLLVKTVLSGCECYRRSQPEHPSVQRLLPISPSMRRLSFWM